MNRTASGPISGLVLANDSNFFSENKKLQNQILKIGLIIFGITIPGQPQIIRKSNSKPGRIHKYVTDRVSRQYIKKPALRRASLS